MLSMNCLILTTQSSCFHHQCFPSNVTAHLISSVCPITATLNAFCHQLFCSHLSHWRQLLLTEYLYHLTHNTNQLCSIKIVQRVFVMAIIASWKDVDIQTDLWPSPEDTDRHSPNTTYLYLWKYTGHIVLYATPQLKPSHSKHTHLSSRQPL